jgi:hypothetical protein
MMMPATRKTSAMPRVVPVPSHGSSVALPSSERAQGMIQNSAIGAIRNAVIGAAADSNAIANPNTRPCLLSGTTRWMIVCSAASAAGIKHM